METGKDFCRAPLQHLGFQNKSAWKPERRVNHCARTQVLASKLTLHVPYLPLMPKDGDLTLYPSLRQGMQDQG